MRVQGHVGKLGGEQVVAVLEPLDLSGSHFELEASVAVGLKK